MLSKCLFFVRWTPFVRSNMWPVTVGAFWLLFLSVRAFFVIVALPTDKRELNVLLYACTGEAETLQSGSSGICE